MGENQRLSMSRSIAAESSAWCGEESRSIHEKATYSEARAADISATRLAELEHSTAWAYMPGIELHGGCPWIFLTALRLLMSRTAGMLHQQLMSCSVVRNLLFTFVMWLAAVFMSLPQVVVSGYINRTGLQR